MIEYLPVSIQIVLSRSDRECDLPTAFHADGVTNAAEIADAHDADRAYVIGGAGIYHLFQPHLNRMILSRIRGEYDGDAFYPEWNSDEWSVDSDTEYDGFVLEE